MIMPAPLFKTKQIKIQTLGEYLAECRVKLNLDLKTLSMLTQIKPEYLENMENSRWDRLPSEVYIKGFLRRLAEFYHFSENLLLKQYDKERSFELKEPKTARQKRLSLTLTPKTLILATGILVVLAAVSYVFFQIRSVTAAPLLEITEPANDLTVSGNSVLISGKTEIGAEVTINNQAVLVDKMGEFEESLILSPGLNIVEIKSTNKFGKSSRTVRKISTETPIQASGTAGVLPVNITVEIGPNSAWVFLEVDGVLVQQGTMLAGASKTVSARESVVLTSANAGSTRIIYNGHDLGLLGRENEVVRNVEFAAALAQ